MGSAFFSSLKGILTKPIPVKEILTTPIPLPGVSQPQLSNVERLRLASRRTPAQSKCRSLPKRGNTDQIGTIESGARSQFSINGCDFRVTSKTWVFGEVKVGKTAKIKLSYEGEIPLAVTIRISE